MRQVRSNEQEWCFKADQAGAHRCLGSKIAQAISLKPLVGAPFLHAMVCECWWERIFSHRTVEISIVVVENSLRRAVEVVELAAAE